MDFIRSGYREGIWTSAGTRPYRAYLVALAGAASAETTGTAAATSLLEVRFGDHGDAFTMTLEDNDTAAAIKKHVGTADWRLPIYHYGCVNIGLNQKTLI